MSQLNIQIVSKDAATPSKSQLRSWLNKILKTIHCQKAELTIRIVDTMESAQLNQNYRHKNGPTNILSFPFTAMPGLPTPYLGDLVICASIIADEAKQQNKPLEAHWLHLLIHGILHLRGYDHQEEKSAEEMRMQEINILNQFGYPNPYAN